jgi:uncharacterized membrane protein YjjB (DUF3815 family)
MEKLPIWIHFIFSLIGTAGFSVFLSVPKIDVPVSGLAGAVGWTIYMALVKADEGTVVATFIATLVIGTLGIIFSKILKKPSSVYIIPGIIPLVPGYGMYTTMILALTDKFELSVRKGLETILVGLAIACGLVLTESVRRMLRKKKLMKK